ncbi:rhamnan synthesis F family protein [uncultured Sphingomonas sp.]|uniref:rhamnan synthesis F family protein n=1 Tax=uncultured Sphingomonas sp. TaxID=158754 RepID=UPI0035CC23CE
MVVIVDTIDRTMDITSLAFASGILLRENRGYDFGAWAAVIHRLAASISRCDVLAIANDSVIGPSSRFGEMLERVEASNAGVIGLVESDERRNHFQSFVLFFKRDVLKTRHFRKFWSKVRSGNRTYVIDHYELRLKQIFEAAGSRTETLFPLAGEPGANPTLTAWDRLLDAGFPYLKLELLRSNPRGVALQDWEQVAAANGLSPGLVQDHVLALQTVTPGPWAIDT